MNAKPVLSSHQIMQAVRRLVATAQNSSTNARVAPSVYFLSFFAAPLVLAVPRNSLERFFLCLPICHHRISIVFFNITLIIM